MYTWGKGYCGALGHEDEIDKTSSALVSSLKNHLAVQVSILLSSFHPQNIWKASATIYASSCYPQVCASKRKTFVLVDTGSVFAFGWMGFGSLGFTDRGVSDKITRPRILDSLRAHYVSQISTGLYHTVVITNRGQIFGFGDNERALLGHDSLRGCLQPTEIFVDETVESGVSSHANL